MNRHLARTSLVLLAVTSLTAGASAEIPDLDISFASVAQPGGVVYARPDGLGAPFTQAYDGAGGFIDATVTLTLLNYLGDPVANYPREDMWLEPGGGVLTICPLGAVADADTDEFGVASWVQPIRAVGCTVGFPTQVIVAGSPLNQPGLDLAFISSDLDGSGETNLTDVTLFATNFLAGNYTVCSDCYFDGQFNLADLTLFAQGYFSGPCP